jgi:hypothetical protein
MAEQPRRVTLFAYQVGFGDCFLLRFEYAKFRRHVLIDFGSFPKPDWGVKGYMRTIAEKIAEDCEGKLDAVVATHRHADHINGFATSGDGSGDVIAACDPDLVVQPWTEDPDAHPEATSPTASLLNAQSRKPFAPDVALRNGRAFVATLQEMETVAGAVVRQSRAFAEAGHTALAQELAFLGGDNISNRSAVENLIKMGRRPGAAARYVFFGADSGLENVLPGVKVRVLGPPTLEQTDSILKQATSNPQEFWQLQARAAKWRLRDSASLREGSAAVPGHSAPPHTRWLIQRLRSLHGREMLEIVRSLDKALNNTSVILLFQVGSKKLLFPGDAQIENWQYALSQPGVKKLLSTVDLYKVGHHGSRNATPRTLWDGFSRRSGDETPDRLRTVMSSEEGHHGSVANKSEVPRQTLVEALHDHSSFTTTQDLRTEPGERAEISIEL